MDLKKPKGTPKRSSGGLLPPPELSGDFSPFLSYENIGNGKLGAKAKLTFLGDCSIDEENQYGPRLMCEVKLGKEQFSYGVKLDNLSYSRLYKRFGKDSKKWKGTVEVEVKKNMGKLYIAVV